MALNGSDLASEAIAAINTLSTEDKKDQSKVFEKMCSAILDHIKNNIELNLNSIFTSGVPVPQDGGAALQSVWKTLGFQGGLVR